MLKFLFNKILSGISQIYDIIEPEMVRILLNYRILVKCFNNLFIETIFNFFGHNIYIGSTQIYSSSQSVFYQLVIIIFGPPIHLTA